MLNDPENESKEYQDKYIAIRILLGPVCFIGSLNLLQHIRLANGPIRIGVALFACYFPWRWFPSKESNSFSSHFFICLGGGIIVALGTCLLER